ncbi:MAG: hypothetical protein ISP10_09740 [Aeromicrobium sp.]|jgi:uncharacterized membrane protein (Fun14 family)|nr:hypothetical protein [Aeromicrobium sp.]
MTDPLRQDPFAPRTVGAALDDAIGVYRRHFKALALAAVCTVFPVALIIGLAQDVYYRGYFEVIFSDLSMTAGAPDPGIGIFIAYAVIMAASGLLLFVRAYFDASVLAAAPGLITGARPRFTEILKGGLKRWGWYLLAQLLVSILTSAAAFASFFVLGVGGLVASVFVTFTGVVTVVEQTDPVSALSRSFALVRGSFWRVAGYLVLMFGLSTAFQGAIASPAALGQLVPALGASDPLTALLDVPVWWRVVEGLSFGAASALTAPFTALALFHLYIDLRARKEGMDLVVRARELARAA